MTRIEVTVPESLRLGNSGSVFEMGHVTVPARNRHNIPFDISFIFIFYGN